jgi:hypothetical protein
MMSSFQKNYAKQYHLLKALFGWAATVAEAAVSWLWWESCCAVKAAMMKDGRLATQL